MGNEAQGQIFVLSAPAGTGKTTLVKKLTEEFHCVLMSVSSTTRQPREGEKCGIDYNFVTEQEFEKKIAEGDFLEYVSLYGCYYGTSRSWVQAKLNAGKHVMLVIDTQGALQLQKKIIATYIFVAPPSLEVLRGRLLKRKTESALAIEQRLEWAKHEMDAAGHYDYQIVNDDLDTAYDALRSIVVAEEHRIIRKI